MEYDYSELRGLIKAKCGTQNKFAEKLGIGRVSLSQRLNNQLEFTQGEMNKACDILEKERDAIPYLFFTVKVQKRELIA